MSQDANYCLKEKSDKGQWYRCVLGRNHPQDHDWRMVAGPLYTPSAAPGDRRELENPHKHSTSTIEHPSHYNQGKYEVIDVIADWRLNFNCGNAVKYIARSPFKGKQLEDLKKAAFYLADEIKRVEGGMEPKTRAVDA